MAHDETNTTWVEVRRKMLQTLRKIEASDFADRAPSHAELGGDIPVSSGRPSEKFEEKIRKLAHAEFSEGSHAHSPAGGFSRVPQTG